MRLVTVVPVADATRKEPIAPRSAFGPRIVRANDEGSLVDRIGAGDDAPFEVIFDRYHRNLLAFCHHMLGSREEAEDAVQHAFMAAYRGLRSGDRPSHLKAWLYTIARNQCLSVLRARRQHVPLDQTAPATEGLVAEVDRRAELRALVRDLGRLPDDQRAALILVELDDQPHDAIADVLGVRREKVKALVFQAREGLMGWRTAREAPCREIREQLSILTGAARRGAHLRRHVDQCAGCAEYETEVRRERAALAAVLPVVPASCLKPLVLGSIASGRSAAVTATGGGATTSGVAAAALAAKGAATKMLAIAAVAGGIGGATYVEVDHLQQGRPGRPAQVQPATRSTPSAPAGRGAPSTAAAAPAAGGARTRPPTTLAVADSGRPLEASLPSPLERSALGLRPPPPLDASGKAPAKPGRAVWAGAADGTAAVPDRSEAPGTPATGTPPDTATTSRHRPEPQLNATDGPQEPQTGESNLEARHEPRGVGGQQRNRTDRPQDEGTVKPRAGKAKQAVQPDGQSTEQPKQAVKKAESAPVTAPASPAAPTAEENARPPTANARAEPSVTFRGPR